ncbi:putative uncharacterized protein [Prevotella sp. CAG:891]|nr:putative uncharacterized protein [Prevotella sp. CAG:891]
MDEKLLPTLNKIIQLTEQNPEFGAELRKKLGMTAIPMDMSISDDRLSQIYEYCIEKIVHKQAEDFYLNFPLSSIIPTLIDDYCRMEYFRRKDSFGDFCLAMYQQIESVTNRICNLPQLNEIAEKLWGYPAYIKTGENAKISIDNRADSKFTIADLVFVQYTDKSMSALQALYAMDKIKSVVYFVGYGAMMKYSDYENYVSFTTTLRELYQCRNMNHRGNVLKPWEEEIINKVNTSKSIYYFKFLGTLTQYIEDIKSGWNNLPALYEYAKSLGKKRPTSTGLKVLRKIELPKDNKKRFK